MLMATVKDVLAQGDRRVKARGLCSSMRTAQPFPRRRHG